MTDSPTSPDPLDAEMDNMEAINYIKELYNVDEPTARKMWHKFIGTVKRLRDISKKPGDTAKADQPIE